MKTRKTFITATLVLITFSLLQVISIAQSGSLDLSFNTDGKVTTNIGSSNDISRSVAIQRDGKIVVAGFNSLFGTDSDVFVMRFNTNGTLDNSFDTDGKLTTDIGSYYDRVYAVAIQSDGKIVVAGTSIETNDYIFVVRYNGNGTLDKTFGTEGIVKTSNSGTRLKGHSMAIQADGKILVAGSAHNGTDEDIAVVRFNRNGTLDTSFDMDGIAAAGSFSLRSRDYANSIAIQSDGKIVLTGVSSTPINDRNDIALVRFNVNGSLDMTFDTDGKLITNLVNTKSYGNSIGIQSNGKIVVCGTIRYMNSNLSGAVVLRYNSNGTLDNTFSGDGIVYLSGGINGNTGESVALQTDGKILVLAYDLERANKTLFRLNTDGSLDKTFGNNGKIDRLFTGRLYEITSVESGSVAIQTDGKIITMSSISTPDDLDYDVGLVRMNGDGSTDFTFGDNGYHNVDVIDFDDHGRSIILQKDGKIVVAGSSFNGLDFDFLVVRYNTDGTLDNSFGWDGFVTTDLAGFNDHGESVAIQSDGKIVVAGYSSFNGNDFDIAVIRYNTDGTLDQTFNSFGSVVTAIGTAEDRGSSIAIQNNGKIVVAGYTDNGPSTDMVVIRYNSNGTLDNTFDNDGKRSMTLQSEFHSPSIAIQSDGKIVLAGTSTNGNNLDFLVVRLNSNGSYDSSFDNDGRLTTDVGNSDDFGNSVAIQSDGKILVAGTSSNGLYSDFSVVRYNTNGTLDNTFDSDGKILTAIGNTYDVANALTIQTDGKILVAGASYNGSYADFALVRYNRNGTLDISFDSDGKVTTLIQNAEDWGSAIAIQSDGKILVAGNSSKLLNSPDIAVVRYNNTIGTSSDENLIDDLIFDIYPNPNSESFLMVKYNDYKEGVQIVIQDVLGKIYPHQLTQEGQTLKLDISSLPSGSYILTFNDGQRFLNKKFLRM